MSQDDKSPELSKVEKKQKTNIKTSIIGKRGKYAGYSISERIRLVQQFLELPPSQRSKMEFSKKNKIEYTIANRFIYRKSMYPVLEGN